MNGAANAKRSRIAAPAPTGIGTSCLGWILPAAVAFLIMTKGLSSHGFLGDIGWDVANGLWILQHHQIPLQNHLSVAMAGAPWWNSEWLWGLYMGLGWQQLGTQGVFLAGLVWLAVGAVLLALRLRGGHLYWNLILAAAVSAAIMPFMSPRPQIASYALWIFLLWAVDRRERWPIWALAGSTLLWTNIHGSVVLVPLTLGALTLFPPAGTTRWQRVGPLALSVLLLGAHPGGFSGTGGLLTHIFQSGNYDVIQEWASPNFHLGSLWLTALALGLGLGVIAPWLWRRKELGKLVLLFGCAGAALFAVRFAPYLDLLVAAWIGACIPQRWRLVGEGSAGRRLELRAASFGVLMVAALVGLLFRGPVFPARYPPHAVAWLREHGAQNVFAYYSIGASLEPFGIKPFVDGRNDLWLQRAWWPEYLGLLDGSVSVLTFLHQHDPSSHYVLWFTRSAVARTLDTSAQWHRVLTDPNVHNPYRSSTGPWALWVKGPAPVRTALMQPSTLTATRGNLR